MSFVNKYTTGGTYSAGDLIFNLNDGTTYTVSVPGGSGTSGTSGVNGTSGINGTSGTSGLAGVNGTSGSSGVTGNNGTSGSSGVTGTSGTSGVTGATPSLSQVLLVGNTSSTNIILTGTHSIMDATGVAYITPVYSGGYVRLQNTGNSYLQLTPTGLLSNQISTTYASSISSLGTEITLQQNNTTLGQEARIKLTSDRVWIFGSASFYKLPNTDGSSGQVLTTDGAGDTYWASGGAGTSGTSGINGTNGTSGSGASPTSITYASLATLKSTSSLTPGAVYYISDKDIILTALDNKTLSVDGKRLQWVVKDTYYTPQIVIGLFTINYIGIYGQGIAAGSVPVSGTSPGDTIYRAIWGGQLWVRNSSGTDGTPINSFTLNSAWTLVAGNTSTHEWRSFEVIYDFDNDVVRQQSDLRGNVLRVMSIPLVYADWGNDLITNNSCGTIYNNWKNSTTKAQIHFNSNNGIIYNNSNNGFISNNSNIGAISNNSSNGGTTFDIYNNSNNGYISYNNSTVNMVIENCNIPFGIGGASLVNRNASLIGAYIYNSTIGTAVSNSSNTVYTTLFTMHLIARETYRLKLIGNHQTVLTTTGIKIKLGGTATCNVAGKIFGSISTAAVATELAIVAATMTAELITTGVSNNNTPHSHGADIIFKCTVSGTLLITFASEVNTSAAQVNIGTTCTLERLV